MPNFPAKILAPVICMIMFSGCSDSGKKKPSAARAYQPDYRRGMYVYNAFCGECHNTGKNSAPMLDEPHEWDTRALGFTAILQDHASKGFLNMPGKGAHEDLSEENIADAVHYMIRQIASEEED
jgi:cytochrome c5